MKTTFTSDWNKAKSLFPSMDEMSGAAALMTGERIELKHLESLKCRPIRAIHLLEDSIKAHANFLIQRGVLA